MSQFSDRNKLLTPISEHDHIQGGTDASVVLVEYGNYQCLSCGEVHRMIQAIQQQIQLCFVFRHSPRPHHGYLLQYASDLQLDIDRFLQGMTNHVHAELISQSIQGGIQSGVRSTPALFINGDRYQHAWDIESLLAIINLRIQP